MSRISSYEYTESKFCCNSPSLVIYKDNMKIEETTQKRKVYTWVKKCTNCKKITVGSTLVTEKNKGG